MIDINNLKIKYLLGSYRDSPDYPTIEDFEYLYANWINEPEGMKQLEQRRNMTKDHDGYYFTNWFVQNDIFDGDKVKAEKYIESLIQLGKIKNVKNSVTYKIEHFEY